MKGKYFVALGVSLLAIGAAAGFVGTRQIAETRAEPAEVAAVSLRGSFDSWTVGGIAFAKSGDVWSLEKTLAVNDQFIIKITGGAEKYVKYDWSLPAAQVDYDYIGDAGGGDRNFKVTQAATFVFEVDDNFYADPAAHVRISVKRYNVTKYAVVGAIKEDDPIDVDTIDAGKTYAIPDDLVRIGYDFGGWFTDLACTEPYVAGAPTADLSLYGKLTCTQDRYFYYVTQSNSATPNYIYSFKRVAEVDTTGEFGAWPGVRITEVPNVEEVSGVLHFENVEQKIYKIPYSSSLADTHIVIHANKKDAEAPALDDKTGDLALSNRAAYWYSKRSTSGGPNANAGSAIDFLVDAEAIRNAAPEYKGHSWSVCGVTKENASSLYSRYAALSEEVRDYIDRSYTYTYVDADTWTQDNIRYDNIMLTYQSIANQPSGILSIQGIKEEQTVSAAIIGALAAVAGIGFVSFVALRRKKINL